MFSSSRFYYGIGIALIVIAIFVFMKAFEKRRPKTREVVVISVMITLAFMGRVLFFMTPQFKPCAAIIILTGITLGKEAGFITGVMTAFVSNFFFGQGPWTPWQMAAFGIVGFMAGALFEKRYREREIEKKDRVILCFVGLVETVVIYGLIMDTAAVLIYTDAPTLAAFVTAYSAGFLFNIIHGTSTVIFLWLLANPIIKKMRRINYKYGMYNKAI